MKRWFVAVAVAVGVWACAGAGPAAAAPLEIPDLVPAQIDPDNTVSCTQLVPKALSLDSTPTTLSVRVLLDGAVDEQHARAAAERMRIAYTPLSLPLEFSFERVDFGPVTDAMVINQLAKAHFGGARPAGADVVYTMTNKDLTVEGSPLGDNVAGLADCIGGVRFPDRAFAVGEVIPDGAATLLGLIPTTLNDGTAKTMAHEIGHLFGGHHHYSSPEGLLATDPNALSLMGPVVSFITLRFSTLESLAVRGHAQLYARP